MTYPPIVPYLAVSDADAAIAFYKRAFGAEERMRVPRPNDARVMHAEVAIAGGLVMLADGAPEIGFAAPRAGEAVPVGLMTALATPDLVDATFARAVEAGARAETEPHDAPWGARFAGVVDPFGHRWWLHAPLPA